MTQRILVVDDDHKLVRLLRASLEQAGYQVVVAYDGETALHALRRERPDLVVLDLMLPDRDGWDVKCHNFQILGSTPGVNLRIIQSYLGHSSPKTTAIYTHLTRKAEDLAVEAINRVMEELQW